MANNMVQVLSRRAPRGAGTLVALAAAWALVGCSGGTGGTGSVAATPQSIAAFPGDTEVTLTWSPVPGAIAYTIYWDTTPNLSLATANAIPSVAPPFLHQGLSNGSDYYYRVTATSSGGEGTASALAWARPRLPLGAYDPPWASVVPTRLIDLLYDPAKTAAENATDLATAIGALIPGDRLELSSGTWVVDSGLSIDRVGSAAAPIWIAAKPGALPVLTRSNALAAVLQIGAAGGARFVAVEGLELTGGGRGIELVDAQDVWINLCHVHDTDDTAISAETFDTARLHITRNQINDAAGEGAGVVLGGLNEFFPSSSSVVAMNNIFDCRGPTAAGIWLRQGTNDSIVAENQVHDTDFPCILVGGTATLPWNLIERNTCYNSLDNVMEIQSQAWVFNNLLMNGAQGFSSHDVQPPTANGVAQEVEFVHNTIINSGRGADLAGWDGRPGLVFANNVVYSETSDSARFIGGSNGVLLFGNTFLGTPQGLNALATFNMGTDLGDFVNATWAATARDITPSAGSPIIDAGDPSYELPLDLRGLPRTGLTVETGCIDLP